MFTEDWPSDIETDPASPEPEGPYRAQRCVSVPTDPLQVGRRLLQELPFLGDPLSAEDYVRFGTFYPKDCRRVVGKAIRRKEKDKGLRSPTSPEERLLFFLAHPELEVACPGCAKNDCFAREAPANQDLITQKVADRRKIIAELLTQRGSAG